MENRLKGIVLAASALAIALAIVPAAPAQTPPAAQTAAAAAGPPPSTGGFFPLGEVKRGMTATAWTVFSGTKPEPMGVEILGILRNARGPRQDLILARLTGAKPDYTGVVEGMSGSPVYIGKRLLGALSYRIGQFSKEPIAGITPIEQMLPVRSMAPAPAQLADADQAAAGSDNMALNSGGGVDAGGMGAGGMEFRQMETPLTMTGFAPAAIGLWQQKMAGTSLAMVAAGGSSGDPDASMKPSVAAEATLEPGSAVSALLVSGDLEISATCTVTYLDSRHLLACGHPVLQAGPVSLPMTTANVVTTLASPLNAFKIINTGAIVGSFTEDRDAAIGGIVGAQARMIPVHITVHDPAGDRQVNVEILDLPNLTPQAFEVVLYDALLQNNDSAADTSYHLTGNIDLEGLAPCPLNIWASGGDQIGAQMGVALQAGERFSQLYTNGARRGLVREVDVHADAIPHVVKVELVNARLVSNNIVHAGDTVEVEATVRPWQQPERNIRIPIKLPARLDEGNVRLLISDAGTLDRTLNQPHLPTVPPGLPAVLAEDRRMHPQDRIYVSLLVPEAQAGMDGETLTSLPLSVANALEPVRSTDEVTLNGESAVVAGDASAGGVLDGFEVLNLHIDAPGSLN
ncbi:MAG: SpoIVB peptidase S55 [Terracidiphilus sp.]